MVPWMSGLVSGLQNRVRRFESARNLTKPFQMFSGRVFLYPIQEALEKSYTEQLPEDFKKLIVEAETTALWKYLSILV